MKKVLTVSILAAALLGAAWCFTPNSFSSEHAAQKEAISDFVESVKNVFSRKRAKIDYSIWR